jgi:CubicO group peptidase (beta-lactamase class C family)
MKKIALYFFVVLVMYCFYRCAATKKIFDNTIINSSGQVFNLDIFAGKLDSMLSINSIKHGFVIYHALYQTSRVGGLKRTAADPPQTNFSLTDRFNPASVTKVITATAVLKILNNKKYSLDTTIADFLPSAWTIAPSIRKITFRSILLHRSGIVDSLTPSDTYAGLKQYFQTGIHDTDFGKWLYSNYAFDLCRILIPYLNGYHDVPGSNIDADTYALFEKYMQDSLFTPLNIMNVSYQPAISGQTLFYLYPPGTSNGTDFRNTSPGPGSAGVQLSVNELGTFLFNLINSTILLSDSIKQLMLTQDLGWDNAQQWFASNPSPVRVHSKGGWLSLNSTQGLEAFMQYYENGLLLVGVYNGQDPHGLENGINAAYAQTWK